VRSIWLRTDHEHHSLAIFTGPCAVDHFSFELPDWNAIRDWADHFSSFDIELIWGPGRHGPGNNLFIFIADPDGNKIELSAELESYSVHRPLGIGRSTARPTTFGDRHRCALVERQRMTFPARCIMNV